MRKAVALLPLLAVLLSGCEFMPKRQVYTTDHSYISTRKPAVQFHISPEFKNLGSHSYEKYRRYASGIGGSTNTYTQNIWVKSADNKTVQAALSVNDIQIVDKDSYWYPLKKWRPSDCTGKKVQINGVYFEVCAMPTSDQLVTAGWNVIANSPYNVPKCSNSAFLQHIPITSDYMKLEAIYSEPVSCEAEFNEEDSDQIIQNAISALGGH